VKDKNSEFCEDRISVQKGSYKFPTLGKLPNDKNLMSSPWTLIGTEVHEPVGMPKAHFPHQCFLLSILTKQWKLLSFNPSPVF
jgi:hypothetical protein